MYVYILYIYKYVCTSNPLNLCSILPRRALHSLGLNTESSHGQCTISPLWSCLAVVFIFDALYSCNEEDLTRGLRQYSLYYFLDPE